MLDLTLLINSTLLCCCSALHQVRILEPLPQFPCPVLSSQSSLSPPRVPPALVYLDLALFAFDCDDNDDPASGSAYSDSNGYVPVLRRSLPTEQDHRRAPRRPRGVGPEASASRSCSQIPSSRVPPLYSVTCNLCVDYESSVY
ncbi:hypothetical protein C8J57DRAFT_1324997 [Mycena rebaudengoi]|nr:hypothetical protein C8J57DRAFT_1324997 [Mycena rebaudengoi]